VNPRFEKLKESVRASYDNSDASHDFAHIERVLSSCRRIGETVGANLEILLPAGLLHDIVNVPKNHPDRLRASEQAAEQARGILQRFDYSDDECARIGQVILEHSFSRGMRPSSIESACLQDADRLDAIGAIGVLRVTTCGGKMGSSYYDPADPLSRSRPLDDRRFSLDHFEVKLFKLADGMNTEFGKKEGQRRAVFMRAFVEQLVSELP
jgi:uncharacterized protein